MATTCVPLASNRRWPPLSVKVGHVLYILSFIVRCTSANGWSTWINWTQPPFFCGLSLRREEEGTILLDSQHVYLRISSRKEKLSSVYERKKEKLVLFCTFDFHYRLLCILFGVGNGVDCRIKCFYQNSLFFFLAVMYRGRRVFYFVYGTIGSPRWWQLNTDVRCVPFLFNSFKQCLYGRLSVYTVAIAILWLHANSIRQWVYCTLFGEYI